MARARIDFWVVVQHSGYGYSGNPQFEQGLETRNVTTAAERDLVRKAGGIMFEDGFAAEEWAFEEMYRGERLLSALVPETPGTFSDETIDDLRIYVPNPALPDAMVGAFLNLRDELR